MTTQIHPTCQTPPPDRRQVYRTFTDYQHAEDFKRLDFIVRQIQSRRKPGLRVMDIGCGNGDVTRVLGSLGFRVLGVDIDPASVAEAERRNPFPHVRYELMNAEALPRAGQYDVLVCSEVLEHLDMPDNLLEMAYRLLKPGGLLIVTVPNGYGPREMLMTKPMQWLTRNGFGQRLAALKRALGYTNVSVQSSNPNLTHLQFFSRFSLEHLLNEHGFQPVAFGRGNFIDRVFPYSLLANRFQALQRFDCWLSDWLPTGCASGFYTVWER